MTTETLEQIALRVADEVEKFFETDDGSSPTTWLSEFARRLVAAVKEGGPVAYMMKDGPDEQLDWDCDGWSDAFEKHPLYKLPEDEK